MQLGLSEVPRASRVRSLLQPFGCEPVLSILGMFVATCLEVGGEQPVTPLWLDELKELLRPS